MVRSGYAGRARTNSSGWLRERAGPSTRTFGGSASGSTSTTTSGWSTGWRMSASETPWRRAERWISTPSQRITDMVPPEGALDFTGARIERQPADRAPDRKSAVEGKRGDGRVNIGGGRDINKKK